MRRTNVIGFFFFLLIGMTLGGWLSYKFKPLPPGKVIANQSSLDSLQAFIVFADSIENLPMEPVVTKTDTVYVEVPVEVYISSPEPSTDIDDTTITHYNDSLVVEKEVSVWVDIMVKGVVDTMIIEWNYKPVIRTIETITEKPVYQPVITTVEIPKYITGHYVSGTVSINARKFSDKSLDLFTFGIDYDIVRRNRIYGLQYRRYSTYNAYGIKIGINLRTLFKKNR